MTEPTAKAMAIMGKGKAKKGFRVKLAVAAGLLLLSLIFTACADVPGQDPPCVGARKAEPGCEGVNVKINDDKQGGQWYQDWAFNIVKDWLAQASINAVKISVSLFWTVYTDIGSTDFVSCENGANAASVTCVTVQAAEPIKAAAFILIPMILVWKFFRSYYLGSILEKFQESGISFSFKAILCGGFIYFQSTLITVFFGMSNALFEAIIGGPATLHDISVNVIGTNSNSGVESLAKVENIGLLVFTTIICFFVAIVFIGLALVFFLRTILIFVHFTLASLAFVAGITDEFGYWLKKWTDGVQALLVAPLPVAASLALIKAYSMVIPSAHDKPVEFILQMVYIIAFLLVGCILMFKISGGVGLGVASAAIAGVGVLAGAGAIAASAGFKAVGAGAGKAVSGASAAARAISGKGGSGEDSNQEKSGTPTTPFSFDRLDKGQRDYMKDMLKPPPTPFSSGAAAHSKQSALLPPPTMNSDQQFVKALRGLTEALSTMQAPNPAAGRILPALAQSVQRGSGSKLTPPSAQQASATQAYNEASSNSGDSNEGIDLFGGGKSAGQESSPHTAPTPPRAAITPPVFGKPRRPAGVTRAEWAKLNEPHRPAGVTEEEWAQLVPPANPNSNPGYSSNSNSRYSWPATARATNAAPGRAATGLGIETAAAIETRAPQRPVFANPQQVKLRASVSIPNPFGSGNSSEAERERDGSRPSPYRSR